MGLLVRRDEEAAHSGVWRLAVEPGHRASSRPTQCDSRSKMYALVHPTVGDIGGASTSRDPGDGQCRGDGARSEYRGEPWVCEQAGSAKIGCVRKGRI